MREGWKILKLKEVCQIRPPKKEAKEMLSDDEEVSFVPMDLLGINRKYISLNGDKLLSEVSSSYTYFRDEDVLLAKITPCFENGKLGIAKGLTNTVGFGSSEFIVYRTNEVLNNEFLYYFLSQEVIREKGKLQMTGAVGHKRIPKDFYEEILIPIPPLPEQKQIVTIIDKAFAAIDQAKANIEHNIENAKELFLSKKEFLFDALSKECKVLPIESVCEQIFAGGDAPKENFSKEKTEEFNVPIIANAVKDNGLYGYTNEARVIKPSITVAARGSGTGHTEFRNYPFVPIVRLIVLTPDTSIVNAEFLMHAIKNLIIERSGSAIPQLTVPMMKSYSIPVPDINKQTDVNKSLNNIELLLVEYKSKLEEKLNYLEELKKSILQKAFAGQLSEPVIEAD